MFLVTHFSSFLNQNTLLHIFSSKFTSWDPHFKVHFIFFGIVLFVFFFVLMQISWQHFNNSAWDRWWALKIEPKIEELNEVYFRTEDENDRKTNRKNKLIWFATVRLVTSFAQTQRTIAKMKRIRSACSDFGYRVSMHPTVLSRNSICTNQIRLFLCRSFENFFCCCCRERQDNICTVEKHTPHGRRIINGQ